MPRPQNSQDHALAARFGVTLRTVRNWKDRGYPVNDEAALVDVLISQHSRPSGVDRVYHEQREPWRAAMTEEQRDDLYAKCCSLIRVFTELRGASEENWPWPFGEGPDLTPAEDVLVKTRDH